MRLLPLLITTALATGCTVADTDVSVLRALDHGFWPDDGSNTLELPSLDTESQSIVAVFRGEREATRALAPLSLDAELAAVDWDEESVVVGLTWLSSHGDEWLELDEVQVHDGAVNATATHYQQLTEDDAFLSNDASAIPYAVVVTEALATGTGGDLSTTRQQLPYAE